MTHRFKKHYSDDLDDKYKLIDISLEDFYIMKRIGKGSFGKIYLANYIPKNSFFALKFIPYRKLPNVKSGLKHSPKLNHINLVKAYGHFFDTYNGKKYIISIMEYIDGMDLHDATISYDFSVNEICNIVYEIVDGLSYIHSHNYIHRDIKLENILLKDKKIKIVDYDFLIRDDYSKVTDVSCTLIYGSPEMISGKAINYKTDLWSLGVCLYIILTGEYPFDGETDDDIYEEIMTGKPDMEYIPKIFKPIVKGLLKKDQNKRISLQEVIKLLPFNKHF